MATQGRLQKHVNQWSPLKVQQSIHASIELEHVQLSYTPGSLLKGVIKKVQIDQSPQNITVDIHLVGRIRTRVTHTNSGDKSDDHYYAENDFYTHVTRLFHGQVANGINAWPFAVYLPTSIQVEDKMQGLIPVAPPLSFYSHDWEYVPRGRRDFLFCEYYLQAVVTDTTKPKKPIISSLPIFVRAPSSPEDLGAPQILGSSSNEDIKTLHLNPDVGEQSLSMKQRFQTVFQRSTIPQFGFTLTVLHPAVVQVESQTMITFAIRASPDPRNTTPPSLVEKPPALVLTSMELHLQYCTGANHLRGSTFATDTESNWSDLSRMQWKEDAEANGHKIPYGDGALDLGREYNMRMTWDGLEHSAPPRTGWKAAAYPEPERLVWSSVETYHLSQKHRFSWALKVSCAGKTRTIKGKAPVMVLGPSEERHLQVMGALTAQDVLRIHRDWTEDPFNMIPVVARSPRPPRVQENAPAEPPEKPPEAWPEKS